MRQFFTILLALLISPLLVDSKDQEVMNISPAFVVVVDNTGYVEAGDDLKAKLEELIALGCDTIHLRGKEYSLKLPIILETNELTIYGHGAIINRDYWKMSNSPFFLDICSKLRITGCVFDIKRPDMWKSYVAMIKFHVDDGTARRQDYEGPRYKYVDEFVFDNNKVIDSNGKTKANSKRDQYNFRDQWGIVSNLRLGGNTLIVQNNRLDVPDMELSGGNWGWDNVLFDGNHVWGGRTTGAYIDLLSRYYGDDVRTYRSVVITNNIVYNLTNNFIALGYDGQQLANTQYDMVRIEGNIAYLSPDCSVKGQFILFKTREFKGDIIIRNNLLDGSNVAPDKENMERRTVTALNFKWGKNRTKTNLPAGTGKIFYEPIRTILPPKAQWDFINNIRLNHFEKVIILK